MKRNEEIDQILTLDQLNDEFEQDVKEWKNDDGKNNGKDDDRNDLLIIKMMYKIVISDSEYLLQ